MALAFPPAEFQYLLRKTPFRMLLESSEDDLALYEDLCVVGKQLLQTRRAAQLRDGRNPVKSLPATQSLQPDLRQLCKRAEKNLRTARVLTAQIHLSMDRAKHLNDQTYVNRRKLGLVLRQLFWPPNSNGFDAANSL